MRIVIQQLDDASEILNILPAIVPEEIEFTEIMVDHSRCEFIKLSWLDANAKRRPRNFTFLLNLGAVLRRQSNKTATIPHLQLLSFCPSPLT
jgi:hypothetical protein